MAYVRSTETERVLVLVNFNRTQRVNISAKTLQKITKQAKLKNLLTTKPQAASVKLLPNEGLVLSF
jgi:ribosomal protein L28